MGAGTLCFLHCTVDDDDRVEEGHGFPQFGADFFDLELGFGPTDAGEFLAASLIFGDEFFREAAILNIIQERLHRFFDFGSDDARAGYVVAPLGGIGDGVAHVGEAAAIHQVDDELEFVQDFEVS